MRDDFTITEQNKQKNSTILSLFEVKNSERFFQNKEKGGHNKK
jgi:hypothetical protein